MISQLPVRVSSPPSGIPINQDFIVHIQPFGSGRTPHQQWTRTSSYAVEVAQANITRNAFNRHTVALASFDVGCPVKVKVNYLGGVVQKATIRPASLGIATKVNGNEITFTFAKAQDAMLEINGDKWKALHLLINEMDVDAPTTDTDDIWFFGPGIDQGSAYDNVTDGVNLMVPSGKTVYLAAGAFITCRLNFINVSDCAVRGHGFILGPEGGYVHREHGGAIHMSRANKIRVEGVTSVGANGFSLSAGECDNVHVNGYRSFSFAGNGDGIDFFCSSNILIENCFLRNSDDCIALYSHRWDWYGDSKNITIRNCVLLPDIAHAINMGTHGNPAKPETTSNIRISNIDILDHEENQLWYQGCIAINVADENLFHDVHVEDVRVERITRGQLLNIRVMQNAMWTSAPGRGIRNVTFKNLSLDMGGSGVVNPSQVLGYDQCRRIENVKFENLTVGGKDIHEEMEKPRWYMVSDLVPMFANEHVDGLQFLKSS
ncbi:glycoside hydrolase family protein [Colletotrichum karsti]|uniref:Glycoside hydrolase family protein n=1 Tax=Colletotrichum karsti TaxID=1095194 RepID=A0A9P6HZY3_9PEZI|nr:glycoside hydrolase family protein [Colletotrichum karsti]KAF9872306.1 glycoside hydrolase family protein [Colletotrichum karsti]